MNRLVAFVRSASDPAARRQSEALAASLLQTDDWTEIVNRRGVRIFLAKSAGDMAPIVVGGGSGVVLGALFRKNETRFERIAGVSSEEAALWCTSGGAALTQACWGGYLACLLGTEDRVFIMRDPAGARPCFVSPPDDAGVRVIFTHLQDFAAIAPLPEVDDHLLALFLAQPRLVTERTGFKGVREVLAGECVVLDQSGLHASIAWRPPGREGAFRRAASANLAGELRRVVLSAARAWADLGIPIVHRLSGGLDSSVALAALASSRRALDLRCITERPDGYPEGDEVEAARAVARRFGVPLVEAAYRAEQMQYRRLLDAPLGAKPSVTELSFADNQFLSALGEAPELALLTSGQGGDQIFYRSSAMCVGADAVRDRLSAAEIIRVALNAARASRRSIWPVLAKAVEFGLLRSPEHYVREILSRAASTEDEGLRRRVVDEAIADDWVKRAIRRGPGEAMRALLLADLQYYHGPSVLAERFVLAPILTSQPIMEFCCAIPVYRTVEGGRDRGLARLAFADDLPASAIDRRRKGDTTRFHAAVARANDAFMRDMLCGGELERRGLFDPAVMANTAPTKVLDFSHHLVAEIWLRKVKALRSAAPVAEGAPALET